MKRPKSYVRLSDVQAGVEVVEVEEELLMDYESFDKKLFINSPNKKNGKRRKERATGGGFGNGEEVRVALREVDLSEVPPHVLSRFVQSNPDSGVLTRDEIDPEAMEGWIIQCPRSVPNLSRLLRGRKINLDSQEPTILSPEDVSQAYEAVAVKREDLEESVFLILPDGIQTEFGLASIPLAGYISVRNRIEDVETPEVTLKKKKKRKLPSGIKERHPIYGVDFSQALSNIKVTRTREPAPSKRQTQEPSPSPTKSKSNRKRERVPSPSPEEISQKLKRMKRSNSRDKERYSSP